MIVQNRIQTEEPDLSFSANVLRLCAEQDIRTPMNLLRLREPEAYIHSLRVATLMDEAFHASEDIIRGSLLHDVGKALIPFSLTLYPCPLTENEKKIVDIHTLLGAELLAGYHDTILNCVLYHHDALFPAEYVQQLRACDIFDALMHNRPYRAACSLAKTTEIMTGMGISPSMMHSITSTYKVAPTPVMPMQAMQM